MSTHLEVERKFLVKKLPDLGEAKPIHYERYILFSGDGFGLRIQSKDDKFELERKSEDSDLSRSAQVIQISREEFEALQKWAIGKIVRDGYLISVSPRISIKIYKNNFEGLMRAEVQFATEDEAKGFTPPMWMGKEITNSPLGKDSKLAMLKEEDFKKLLKELDSN